jgi:hypothetical protein
METLKEIIKNEKVGNAFFNLYDRWLDESEYEDINDYGKAIVKTIAKEFPSCDIKLVQTTKEPFGVKVKMNGSTYSVWIKIKGRYANLYGKKLNGVK